VQNALDFDLEPMRDEVFCAARIVMSLNYTMSFLHEPRLDHPDFSFLFSPGSSAPPMSSLYPTYTSGPYPTNTSSPYPMYPMYPPPYGGSQYQPHCPPFPFSGMSDQDILLRVENVVQSALNYMATNWTMAVDTVMNCVNAEPGQSSITPTPEATHVRHMYDRMGHNLTHYIHQIQFAVFSGKFVLHN
jgi:hypothetical protein